MQKRAFSLIEIMAIIGIVALLTGIAIPHYSTYMNKSRVALAVLALNTLNTKAMALYNEGVISSGISSVSIDGLDYPNNSAIAIDNPAVKGAIFYAPGGVVASNAWAFCVYVSNLSFSGYVDAIGGAYSRLCSKVVANNGVFTTYCGSWNNSSSDIPAQYLPEECSITNVSVQ